MGWPQDPPLRPPAIGTTAPRLPGRGAVQAPLGAPGQRPRVGRPPASGEVQSTSDGPLGSRAPQPGQTKGTTGSPGSSPVPSLTSLTLPGHCSLGSPVLSCPRPVALPTLQMPTLRLRAERPARAQPAPSASRSPAGSSPQLWAWLPWCRRRRKRSRFLSCVQKYTHTTRPPSSLPFSKVKASLCAASPGAASSRTARSKGGQRGQGAGK